MTFTSSPIILYRHKHIVKLRKQTDNEKSTEMYFEAKKSVSKKMAVSMYLYRLFQKESVKLKSIIGDKEIDINIFLEVLSGCGFIFL